MRYSLFVFRLVLTALAACGAPHGADDSPGDDSCVPVDCGGIVRCGECEGAPEIQAPSLDPSLPTDFGDATGFIYSGPDAPQEGVAEGAIDRRFVAVVRGRVTGVDGLPLGDVQVTALTHPEYGSTRTRRSGAFDFAFNGGGVLILQFVKNGYLPVQRKVASVWRDFSVLRDVVMTPVDEAASAVAQGARAFQVVRGSTVQDESGQRQPTLLVPPAVTATMTLPDGSVRPVGDLTIRATEYTVGPNGERAVPGDLPPQSGYTYAVEWSVDEALAAGAVNVEFSQPLFFYLENYLNFPSGGVVPAGYYDRQTGAWKADENGRVIQVVDIVNGYADVDIDGDEVSDTDTALASIGMGTEERQKLAELYSSGAVLWRVPLMHFTPWDLNWPFGPPNDAEYPTAVAKNELPEDNACHQTGSVIECENQVLGESLPVHGTPFRLHYASDRVPGRRTAYQLNITISGPVVPRSLKKMRAEVTVAGRLFEFSFSPAANQRLLFEWDGKDAYGRTLTGAQRALVRVGYDYQLEYKLPSEFRLSFARLGIPASDSQFKRRSKNGKSRSYAMPVRATQSVTLWSDIETALGSWVVSPQNLGSWTLSVHHAYNAQYRALSYGDGGRSPRQRSPIIRTARAGTSDFFFKPQAVAVGPDGTGYIASVHKIWKLERSGRMSLMAGGDSPGTTGDGGAAILAKVFNPRALALGPDGSLYIIDEFSYRVRRVTPQGRMETVVGTGVRGMAGDNGPALSAQLSTPLALAVAADGTLFIGDTSRIRRVDPSGVISTYAGRGANHFSGDGGLATDANFFEITALAVGPDGSVYVGGNDSRVRRITPDGIVRTVAGTGIAGNGTEGGIATQTDIEVPSGMAVGPDGSVFIAVPRFHRIWRLIPQGKLYVAVGSASGGFSGDEGPAPEATLNAPRGVAAAPDGTLFVADWGNFALRTVTPSLPGFSGDPLTVPADDGTQLFTFDRAGRHLTTRDALTQATLYTFAYDASGNLAAVTDVDGEVTRVERDAAGRPLAVVAPYGQRTSFAVDGNGHLASVTNPAGHVTTLTHAASGLLEQMQDARGGVHQYRYDAAGRLVGDANPSGALKTLARQVNDSQYEISLSTGMGRTQRYRVETLSNGNQLRTHTLPDGTRVTGLHTRHGERRFTLSDGSSLMLTQGPDARFGFLAPLESSLFQTPGGLRQQLAHSQSSVLTPNGGPLDVASLTDAWSLNGRTWTKTYDVPLRRFTWTSPVGRRKQVELDAKGRVTRTETAGLAPVTFAYDATGRLVSMAQGARTLQLGYDAAGYLSRATDAMGRSATLTRDALGQVTQIQLPTGERLMFAYDENGNVTSLVPPARPAHGFASAPDDLPTSYTPPTAPATGTVSTLRDYDSDRALRRVSFPDGRAVGLAHDAASGRLASLTTSRTTVSTSFDAAGRLSGLADSIGASLAYAYDGPLVTRVAWSGPVTGSVAYAYTPELSVQSIGVNGTSPVAYTYEADGWVSSAGALTLGRNSTNALLLSTALGVVTTAHAHDAYGDDVGLNARISGASVLSSTLTRDIAGRITRRVDTVQGATQTWDYTYDTAGRLGTVQLNGAAYGNYTYDPNGNRLVSVERGNTAQATYDDQDRMLSRSVVTYAYGASGDLLSKTDGVQVTQYAYDELGALNAVSLPDGTQVDYVMDALGRRVGKRVNGTLVQGFLYDGALRVIAELDGLGRLVSHFVYATQSHAPDVIERAGIRYRVISDHLGSPRLVINSSTGAVVQRMDYGPWGDIVFDSNPGFQPFGFAGGLYDAHTRLTRFGARDYDAESGRWTHKDPIGFGGRDSNLYAYVASDPINRIDPTGHVPIDTIWDFGNVLWDLATGDWEALAFDAAAMAIPYVPAGASKLAKACRGAAGPTKALPAPRVRGKPNPIGQRGTFYVDPKGNVLPTPIGGRITGSPDGKFVQVRDAAGNTTGVRIDGPHSSSTHVDARAQNPHAHVPGVTNPDGTPWLPINL
ncbi:MAG: RHS repeat-associated core domain-containing protein [Myxococcaceae bacterium]